MIIKIGFLIVALLSSLCVFAQAPSSETFNATAPKGATKLTKEQLISIVHNNYKRSTMPRDKENTYQLDGLLISYWGLSVNPDYHRSLEVSQSEMRGYLGRNTENVINFSKIITVNNIRFLVYEYRKGNEVYLRFQSDFNENYKNVNGLTQFKKQDEEKAQTTLQNLLTTIHFKN